MQINYVGRPIYSNADFLFLRSIKSIAHLEVRSMIRLHLKREPHRLDLGHGMRLHVRSCTTALMSLVVALLRG